MSAPREVSLAVREGDDPVGTDRCGREGAAACEGAAMISREMRQVLAELELLSHGRTQKVDANRVQQSKNPSSILRVDEEAYPHEFWRNEWLAAADDEGRQEALEGARNALRDIKLGAPLPEDFLEPGSFRWKCVIADDDSRSISELARVHSISRQTVKSYREKYRGVARRRYEEEAA